MSGIESANNVANQVVALTQEWVQDFQGASAQRIAGEEGSFSLEGALLLPAHVARPSLLVTPQVHRIEPFFTSPQPKGYVLKQFKPDQAFTQDPNEAWARETPLFVDPTPLTLSKYEALAVNFEPVDDFFDSALAWQLTPDRVIKKWENYASSRFILHRERVPEPSVYRALGTLPALPLLENASYTYDLRIDPVLYDVKGQLADSSRADNYSNTVDEDLVDVVFTFTTPYYIGGTRTQTHVPSYELKQPGFYGPDAETWGAKMPPKDFNCALLLPSHEAGGRPSLLVIHLAGATAVTGGTEQA